MIWEVNYFFSDVLTDVLPLVNLQWIVLRLSDINGFKKVCLAHLNAATGFPLQLGLLLRLPPTEKNEEKSREPGDEEEQSHADVKAKEPD